MKMCREAGPRVRKLCAQSQLLSPVTSSSSSPAREVRLLTLKSPLQVGSD